jgi:hypothetical protein
MDLERPSRNGRGAHQGVVFTPPELALRLATPLVARGLPLLDPACGEGALLLAALQGAGGGPEVARQLHGIELNPELRERALERLAGAAGLAPEELSQNILCADALDPATAWPKGAAILANPPWLSFSGRHRAASREQSHHRGPGGWPSLQGAFVHRIAAHCAAEQVPARVLVPGSLLELEKYLALREAIAPLVHHSEPPVELGERAFPGVLEPAVLISLGPGAGASQAPPAARSNKPSELVRRLEGFPRLPPETFADPGVHTGNCGKLLVLERAEGHCAPLRRGADLDPFHLKSPTLQLRLDLVSDEQRRFRIASLEHYCAFPVLLRQTADRPIAAIHAAPTYFRNSLLGVRHVEGLAKEFLVALLNSGPAASWHRENFRDARQRSFPQVKVGHLRTLPTPIRSRQDNHRLHDEIVARVQELTPSASDFDDRREAIDRLISSAFESNRS